MTDKQFDIIMSRLTLISIQLVILGFMLPLVIGLIVR